MNEAVDQLLQLALEKGALKYGDFTLTSGKKSNYYFDGHDIKLSADIGVGIYAVESAWDSDLAGWRTDGNSAEPQVVIRTQFQLLF